MAIPDFFRRVFDKRWRRTDVYNSVYGQKTEINTSTVQGQADAYTRCPVVNTAIGVASRAHSNLKVRAVDKNGRDVDNQTADADLKKLKRFNEYQNFRTFNLQLKTYLLIFGKAYVLKDKLIGVDKYYYYIIPNTVITPVYDLTGHDSMFNKKVSKYQVTVNGEVMYLSTKEVSVIYDSCFDFSGDGLGASRLESLKEPVSTILSSLEASTQLHADGGARGIVVLGESDSDKLHNPLLEKEKENLQDSLKGYGLLRDKFKYIISKTAASFVPMTTKVVDMDIPAIYNIAEKAVYKVYGIPPIMGQDETRYKALPEATSVLYTGSVIPEGVDIINALVELVGIPDRKWAYQPDWSHLDVFQESLAKSANALTQAAQAINQLSQIESVTPEQIKYILEPYIR